MSGYTCPGCHTVQPLFPESAETDYGVTCLGRIPFDPELARRAGRPAPRDRRMHRRRRNGTGGGGRTAGPGGQIVKFVCVPCDKPMSLEQRGSDRGSISLTYGCPDCGYEFAMLTNPMETQVVGSLGVQLGGEAKCPFTGMAQELNEPAANTEVPWTAEAEARMAQVPEFVKPMVRTSIERFARDKGYSSVDESVLDQAKGSFGMDE